MSQRESIRAKPPVPPAIHSTAQSSAGLIPVHSGRGKNLAPPQSDRRGRERVRGAPMNRSQSMPPKLRVFDISEFAHKPDDKHQQNPLPHDLQVLDISAFASRPDDKHQQVPIAHDLPAASGDSKAPPVLQGPVPSNHPAFAPLAIAHRTYFGGDGGTVEYADACGLFREALTSSIPLSSQGWRDAVTRMQQSWPWKAEIPSPVQLPPFQTRPAHFERFETERQLANAIGANNLDAVERLADDWRLWRSLEDEYLKKNPQAVPSPGGDPISAGPLILGNNLALPAARDAKNARDSKDADKVRSSSVPPRKSTPSFHPLFPLVGKVKNAAHGQRKR